MNALVHKIGHTVNQYADQQVTGTILGINVGKGGLLQGVNQEFPTKIQPGLAIFVCTSDSETKVKFGLHSLMFKYAQEPGH